VSDRSRYAGGDQRENRGRIEVPGARFWGAGLGSPRVADTQASSVIVEAEGNPIRPRLLVWIILAALLELCFVAILRLGNLKANVVPFLAWALAAGVVYLTATWWALRPAPTSRSETRLILGAALLFRITLLPLYPSLSDDLYRYQWDGKIQAAEFNPYQFPPQSPVFDPLRGPEYRSVNGKDIAGVYPPLAEKILSWNYALSPHLRGEKLLFVGFEALLSWVLLGLLRQRGLPARRVLIYAWCPLAVIEVAGSGHMDPAVIVLYLLAFYLLGSRSARKHLWGALALMAAVFTKFFPVVLFPVYFARSRRRPWVWMTVLGTLLSLPYLWAGKHFAGRDLLRNLREFSDRWVHNNDSAFALLTRFFGGGYQSLEPARQVVLIVLVGMIGWTLVRRLEPLHACLVILGTVVLLSPNVFPWYVLWLLPLLAIYPWTPWLYFSIGVLLSYHSLIFYEAEGRLRFEPRWLAMEYAPLYGLLLLHWVRARWRARRQLSEALDEVRA